MIQKYSKRSQKQNKSVCFVISMNEIIIKLLVFFLQDACEHINNDNKVKIGHCVEKCGFYIIFISINYYECRVKYFNLLKLLKHFSLFLIMMHFKIIRKF